MIVTSYLRIPGEPVAQEPLIVSWYRVWSHVERFIQQLEVGHIMANVSVEGFVTTGGLPSKIHPLIISNFLQKLILLVIMSSSRFLKFSYVP